METRCNHLESPAHLQPCAALWIIPESMGGGGEWGSHDGSYLIHGDVQRGWMCWKSISVHLRLHLVDIKPKLLLLTAKKHAKS